MRRKKMSFLWLNINHIIKFPTTLLTGLLSGYPVENQQKRLLWAWFFPVQFHVTELQISVQMSSRAVSWKAHCSSAWNRKHATATLKSQSYIFGLCESFWCCMKIHIVACFVCFASPFLHWIFSYLRKSIHRFVKINIQTWSDKKRCQHC